MKASILAFLASPLVVSAAPYGEPSPFKYSFETVPMIECMKSRGSGVRISADVVISAAHVTNDRGPCGVEGVPVEANQPHPIDFVVLQGAFPDGFYQTVSCRGIVAGERYRALGYAFGGKPNMEELTGTNLKLDGGRARMVGRVYPGMSGGPVIDEGGAVVALTVQYVPEVNGANVLELKNTYLCK